MLWYLYAVSKGFSKNEAPYSVFFQFSLKMANSAFSFTILFSVFHFTSLHCMIGGQNSVYAKTNSNLSKVVQISETALKSWLYD